MMYKVIAVGSGFGRTPSYMEFNDLLLGKKSPEEAKLLILGLLNGTICIPEIEDYTGYDPYNDPVQELKDLTPYKLLDLVVKNTFKQFAHIKDVVIDMLVKVDIRIPEFRADYCYSEGSNTSLKSVLWLFRGMEPELRQLLIGENVIDPDNQALICEFYVDLSMQLIYGHNDDSLPDLDYIYSKISDKKSLHAVIQNKFEESCKEQKSYPSRVYRSPNFSYLHLLQSVIKKDDDIHYELIIPGILQDAFLRQGCTEKDIQSFCISEGIQWFNRGNVFSKYLLNLLYGLVPNKPNLYIHISEKFISSCYLPMKVKGGYVKTIQDPEFMYLDLLRLLQDYDPELSSSLLQPNLVTDFSHFYPRLREKDKQKYLERLKQFNDFNTWIDASRQKPVDCNKATLFDYLIVNLELGDVGQFDIQRDVYASCGFDLTEVNTWLQGRREFLAEYTGDIEDLQLLKESYEWVFQGGRYDVPRLLGVVEPDAAPKRKAFMSEVGFQPHKMLRMVVDRASDSGNSTGTSPDPTSGSSDEEPVKENDLMDISVKVEAAIPVDKPVPLSPRNK